MSSSPTPPSRLCAEPGRARASISISSSSCCSRSATERVEEEPVEAREREEAECPSAEDGSACACSEAPPCIDAECMEDAEPEEDAAESATDEGCPGPTGAVCRWNFTKVQRVLRAMHFAGRKEDVSVCGEQTENEVK